MLIDDRVPRPFEDSRSPVDPNWRIVGWIAAAAILAFAAANASGFAAFLILCATVYAACRAAVELVDYADGLREWRQ